MNKQEFFFSGALFFSVCAISCNQWPSNAALICVVCALCAAALFWRGLALRSAEKSSKNAQRQETFQTHQDALIHAMEALENMVQTQGQSLAGQLAATQDVVSRAEDTIRMCIDTTANQFEASNLQTRELLTQHNQALLECTMRHSEQLNQRIDQQHKEHQAAINNISSTDLPGIYMMIQEVEKAIQALTEAAGSGVGEISGAMSYLRRGLDEGIKHMERHIQQECEQTEAHLEGVEKALGELGCSLESGNERQRDWMDSQIRQYQSITEQDLEALRALLKE